MGFETLNPEILRRFYLDFGWIQLVQIEANPKDNKKRICRKVLETLECPEISPSQKDFLVKSMGMLRNSTHVIYQSIILHFLHYYGGPDGYIMSFNNWMNIRYQGNMEIALYFLTKEYLQPSNVSLSYLSDIAIEKGFCVEAPTYPGCWAIRKALEEM